MFGGSFLKLDSWKLWFSDIFWGLDFDFLKMRACGLLHKYPREGAIPTPRKLGISDLLSARSLFFTFPKIKFIRKDWNKFGKKFFNEKIIKI